MIAKTALIAALAASVNAVALNVTVGQGGFVFTPNTVTAAVGDVIHFEFVAGDHSATQSSFNDPCSPLAGGFDSGLQLVSGNTPTFDVTVNSTDPIWVYCAQVGHCQGGMVFAANPPSSGNTYDAFRTIAMGGAAPASGSSSSGAASSSGSSAPAATTSAKSNGGAYGNSASAAKWSAAAMLVGGVLGGAMML